jgi:16S rRNA (cytosine967-C5)-methyltransferase
MTDMNNVNPRNLALKVLLSVERDGAYSSIALNNSIKENKLTFLDASFMSSLVYGVLERKLLLDYIIKQYSKIPLKKIELTTKMILRLGILQLLFMDKIPESAAVNESVKLAKKNKLQKSAGFINAVLRNITRAEVKYTLPDKSKDKAYYLSIKYSCPLDIVKLWLKSYGGEVCENVLKSLSGRPKLTARVNTLKTTPEKLIDELKNEGVEAELSDIDENALLLKNTGSVENLKPFKDGKLYIQDISSQLCVKALNPKPRDIMLDVCSAPGGKSFTSAQYMNNRGKIFAFDIHPHKLNLIETTAKRLGISVIVTDIRDAESDTRELPLADKVLCDVPCSGMGIMNRKPEIRYKDDILNSELPKLQYRILRNSCKYTAVGGVLVYSTCTLNPEENNKNAERFLSEHPEFEPYKLDLNVNRAIDEPENMLTVFPGYNEADGFFISAFKRVRL